MRNPFGKYWRMCVFFSVCCIINAWLWDYKTTCKWFLDDTQNSNFFKICAQLSPANFTVYDGVPTAWEDASLPPAYLKGNFLGSQLKSSHTKLLIPRHYSSSRAHQLTVGSSELLLLLHLSLLSNFPPLSSFLPLIANQPPCKPALHLPPRNFSGSVPTSCKSILHSVWSRCIMFRPPRP